VERVERIVKYQLIMSLIAKSVEVVLMECQQMRLFHMKMLQSLNVLFAEGMHILNIVILNVKDVMIAAY
jgi:site-specific recombinase XerD